MSGFCAERPDFLACGFWISLIIVITHYASELVWRERQVALISGSEYVRCLVKAIRCGHGTDPDRIEENIVDRNPHRLVTTIETPDVSKSETKRIRLVNDVCHLESLAGSAVLLKHTTRLSVGEHFAKAFGT